MKRLLKRKGAIGLAVLAVTMVGVGIAVPVLAQTRQPAASVSTGVYLDSPTLTRVATALGITPAALTGELKTGKTLAQIARERNVAQSSVIDAMAAPAVDRIALQVKYGYMTQEQSQTAVQNVKDQAAALLQQDLSTPTGYNGTRGCGGYGTGTAGFGGMMGGYGGMMRGWGTYGDNPSGTPNSGTQSPNGGAGRGMMGGYGGMMGTW